jgi:lactobin A/cerein 7B family class IIb bacteriocin
VAKIFYNEILIKMKNFDLNGFGVQEMNAEEMRETDGGFIPLVIIAVAVVMSSCIQVNVNSDNNTMTNKADSVANGNSVSAIKK